AFERYLINLPLHAETLANCEVEFTGSFLLIFYVVELLGKTECNKSSEDESKLLRLLTPVVKLYTGKKSIEVISELLECMGGAGYLEDTGIPTLLRDAQVLSIWEGTTNVLSLDVLRSIHRENTLESFLKISRDKINRIPINLELEKGILEIEIQKLEDYYSKLQELDQQLIETDARQLSFAIAKVMISILLVEFTNKINNQKQKARLAIITERWLDNNKVELKPKDVDYIMNSRAILGNE
ncbi:MAG: acyl-CoA dehydrogenase family protein, partial [Candidatus Heimdallarchaeota archaeon]